MRSRVTRGTFLSLVAAMYLWSIAAPGVQAAGPADQLPAASCSQYMAAKRNMGGKMVGQEECMMQDAGLVDPEKKYHRVEMGITGTLSGWIATAGRARLTHFTSAPDLWLTQFGNSSPRAHGILRYEAAKGNSITLIYPEKTWNGKTYVLVPGSGGSFKAGTLKAWDQVFDPANPWRSTKYEKSMLEKGYAIIRVRRNADRFNVGDYSAVLDDGTVWPDVNNGASPELVLDEVRLVNNFLKDRLGRAPTRNYWFGHSAGGYTGLAVNYMYADNVNKEPDGSNLIDGFIDDDPGGGLFVPIVMKNGQDILFRTPEEKAKFVKTIVIAHQLYPLTYSETEPSEMDVKGLPKFMSPYNLDNKRTTLRVMKEKGMDQYFRSYEVRGISHNGGDGLENNGKWNEIQIVNMPRMMDALIDMLDEWVEKGAAPPASRSDAAGVGTGKGIDLPETACPLGVYYAYPQMHSDFPGSMLTGFAPFDGKEIEPLDGRSLLVDMNGNGKRDRRETITEAWRRLGLLKASETFDRAKYVTCVQQSTAKLQQDRFITAKAAQDYVKEAQAKELMER